MARLTSLKPQVGRLAPLLARQTDAQGHSAAAEPWRNWYSLARWKALRWDTLRRDHFTCQCGCNTIEPDTSQLVADHIKPHRGDPRLFWDPENLQTLFKPCHDKAKQQAERAAGG